MFRFIFIVYENIFIGSWTYVFYVSEFYVNLVRWDYTYRNNRI